MKRIAVILGTLSLLGSSILYAVRGSSIGFLYDSAPTGWTDTNGLFMMIDFSSTNAGGAFVESISGFDATNMPTWATGCTWDGSDNVELDGSDDYLKVGDYAAMDDMTNGFFVLMRLNRDQTNDNDMIFTKMHNAAGGADSSFYCQFDNQVNGRLTLFIYDDDGNSIYNATPDTPFDDGAYHWLGANWNGGLSKTNLIYSFSCDGTNLLATVGNAGTFDEMHAGAGILKFGIWTTTLPYDGNFDMIRIYTNGAISTAEIQDIISNVTP